MTCENRSGFLLQWRIENFSFCYHVRGNGFRSPSFFFNKDNKYWCMELYPRGYYGTEGSISLVLRRNVADNDIKISYKIELIGPSRKILAHFNYENKIISYVCSDIKNVDRDIVMQDLQDTNQDNLTIHCHVYEINSHKQEQGLREVSSTISMNKLFFKWNVSEAEESFDINEYISYPNSADFRIRLGENLETFRLFIYRTKNKDFLSHFVRIQLTSYSEFGSDSRKFTHLFRSKSVGGQPIDFWECPLFLKRDDCVVENGFIKIMCEFACSGKFIPDNTSLPVQHPWQQITKCDKVSESYPTLQENLYNMLCDKKHSDVKLCVSESVVEAHKSILASRSPVFSTMFEQDMTETQTGVVTIPDIDVSTLNSFLKFIYTDKLDDMTYELASNLIIIAEKYQVLSLKKSCADFLMSQLKAENACEMLKIADMVCHKELKTFAVDFIAVNSKTIFMLPEWVPWMKSNMELATEIFSKLTENVILS